MEYIIIVFLLILITTIKPKYLGIFKFISLENCLSSKNTKIIQYSLIFGFLLWIIYSLFKKRIIEFSKVSTKFIEYDISKFNKKSINYFYDQSHLNINGARIFTNDIIKKIKMNVIE